MQERRLTDDEWKYLLVMLNGGGFVPFNQYPASVWLLLSLPVPSFTRH